MLLCLDIGNTSIVVCEYENKVVNSFRISTNSLITEETFINNIQNKIFEDCIISSVVPSVNENIRLIIKKLYNLDSIFVNVKMKSNMHILIDNPAELGSDLLVAAIGAYKINKQNNLIIDLGTATKFLVTKENNFLGGAIAPGFMTSFESLFNSAELLNTIELKVPSKVVGSSTVECIQSGSIIGCCAMIEKMVEKIEKEVGKLNVILTGGNAAYILDALSIKFDYQPDLLIEGIVEIYSLNK